MFLERVSRFWLYAQESLFVLSPLELDKNTLSEDRVFVALESFHPISM